MRLKSATFKHIEAEIYTYHETLRTREELRQSIILASRIREIVNSQEPPGSFYFSNDCHAKIIIYRGVRSQCLLYRKENGNMGEKEEGVGFGRGRWGGIWIFVIFLIFILLIIGIN